MTTIEDCVFEANSVFAFSFDTFGGAIYVSSPTNIRRSLIVNNSAFELGGAIYCVNTAMNLDNTTVVDNVAGFDGGGFFSGPGCLGSLDSVTITGSNNEGIFLGGGTVTLRNSIIANNANGIGDIVGAPTSNDYNIIGVIDGYTGTIAPNDLFGTAASPLDPGLGPLAFNGLPMRSMWPISSGAAGDSGDTPKIEDQFGNPRPANGVDDRGAVELQHSADYRDFYIDLGTESGTPSPAYAAAAGVAGVWNGIGLGNYALVDRGGNPSTVDVTVASDQDVFFGSSSIDDESKLLGDEIYDCTGAGGGGAWSLSFTGLQKSPYRVYLYAPERDPISSGEILLDPGAPLPALPAITGGEFALIENGTYQSEPILVLGGNLTISGLQPAGANCAGLAGVQLIPEPDSVTGIGSGSILLLMLARRRKTGAFSDRGRPSS